MTDKHVRRSGDDYADALAALLPTGPAWPRQADSVLMRVVEGFAQIWGSPVDSRAADLLERETDPRFTLEMLSDWERNWGLPDPCFFYDGGDIAGRRKTLLRKMTIEGGQSRAFFINVAADLGYTIRIREYSPFMVGVSRCGGTLDEFGQPRWEIGKPEMRFYWTVSIADVALQWFRASEGQAAIDPHLRIGYPTDLECLLRRWKPAHTEIILDYSGAEATSNPLAGTP